MLTDRFSYLLQQYMKDLATNEEKNELGAIIQQKDNEGQLMDQMQELIGIIQHPVLKKERLHEMVQNVLQVDKTDQQLVSAPTSVHRVRFLRTRWIRYAAAVLVLLILGSVAYLWTTNKKGTEPAIITDNKKPQTDIAPGGEKAVLTLADGTKIVLDDAANGNLAQQGNAQVVKLSNGQVVYNLQGKSGKEVMWNTMSTPAGGQYQVTLPDGTKVWLNAASSITYPTAFIDKKRPVKITGEVYFEVAKNKEKPFTVDVDGKSTVQVLGTSFNINSYGDEENIKTTLLEGSVKVIRGTMAGVSGSSDRQSKSSVILKPGQQAQINTTAPASAISVNSNVDMDKALAWKNGLFNFNGSDLKSVMRQLERWYDIKVKYEGPVSNDIFKGEMYRNVNLSDVLDMLREMDVKFRMEGKTLIVTG